MAALQICSGVLKSGSPALSEIMEWPCRLSSLAFADIFRVSEGATACARFEIIKLIFGGYRVMVKQQRKYGKKDFYSKIEIPNRLCGKYYSFISLNFLYKAAATCSGTKEERSPSQ